jgi:hypothetical protein
VRNIKTLSQNDDGSGIGGQSNFKVKSITDTNSHETDFIPHNILRMKGDHNNYSSLNEMEIQKIIEE